MVECSISNKIYTYTHECKWPSEAADVHRIIVRKSRSKGSLVCFLALLILANIIHLFLVKVQSVLCSYFKVLLCIRLIHMPLDHTIVSMLFYYTC